MTTDMARYLGKTMFAYADPPYLTQGAKLYLDTFTWEHHVEMAELLVGERVPWMVTYDHDKRVNALYPECRRGLFSIAHTAATPHVGREFVVFSDSLQLAALTDLNVRRNFKWVVNRPAG